MLSKDNKSKSNNQTKQIKNTLESLYVNFSTKPSIQWFRMIIQSLGPVGQLLEGFIFTQADIIAQKRIDESIATLKKQLKQVTIDYKSLQNNVEEYSRLFLRFCGMVGNQTHEELRKAYTRQLSNFFDIRYSREKNKLFYQQLLFKLTIDHLYILNFANQYLGTDKGKHHEQSKTLREAIINEFIKKGLDKALIHGLTRDLESMGLMNATQTTLVGGDLHQLYISDLGRKILEQII